MRWLSSRIIVLPALAVLLAGCGGDPSAGDDAERAATSVQEPPTRDGSDGDTDIAGAADDARAADDASAADDSSAADGADDACGPVENPPQQAGSHLIGDTEPPIPYSSVPPTSGWHTSGALEVRIHSIEDPLSEAAQVSVLEADGVVITYHDLPAEDVATLEDLVREHYDGQVALTPYDRLEPGQVALTAWGTLQTCQGLDLAAVETFVDTHVAEDVSPGHSH
jgi:hypothetical protein